MAACVGGDCTDVRRWGVAVQPDFRAAPVAQPQPGQVRDLRRTGDGEASPQAGLDERADAGDASGRSRTPTPGLHRRRSPAAAVSATEAVAPDSPQMQAPAVMRAAAPSVEARRRMKVDAMRARGRPATRGRSCAETFGGGAGQATRSDTSSSTPRHPKAFRHQAKAVKPRDVLEHRAAQRRSLACPAPFSTFTPRMLSRTAPANGLRGPASPAATTPPRVLAGAEDRRFGNASIWP